MRILFLLLIPATIYGGIYPLRQPGIQWELIQTSDPGFQSQISAFEIYYTFKTYFLRSGISSKSFRDLNFNNTLNAGVAISSRWAVGAGVEFFYAKNSSGSKTLIPDLQLVFTDTTFHTFFQINSNGNFSWGATLHYFLFIPLETGVFYEYHNQQALKFHIEIQPVDYLEAGIVYSFLDQYAGFQLSILFKEKNKTTISILKKKSADHDLQIAVRSIYYFKQGRSDEKVFW